MCYLQVYDVHTSIVCTIYMQYILYTAPWTTPIYTFDLRSRRDAFLVLVRGDAEI
jgi:hypothetical protein